MTHLYHNFLSQLHRSASEHISLTELSVAPWGYSAVIAQAYIAADGSMERQRYEVRRCGHVSEIETKLMFNEFYLYSKYRPMQYTGTWKKKKKPTMIKI